MIRHAEAVLPGHPDKFCDQVADRIIQEAYTLDPQAYAQVEVATWSDRIWISGAVASRQLFDRDLMALIHEVGRDIGYLPGNHIDVTRYQLDDHLCRYARDPRDWTEHVNDQSIVIGWAGYDAKTRYLPPEQFLAHALREALTQSTRTGRLAGEGPDGKLIVQLREEGETWILEQLLVSLQHRESTELLELGTRVFQELEAAYAAIQLADPRWASPWDEVNLLVNPNGPFISAGSNGDNGQTGRKLVMDYYGPRVPIGGGALSGKDLTHIDRAGAYAARQAAVETVARGAKHCKVTLAYAPNCDEPLDVAFECEGGVRPPGRERFRHSAIRERFQGQAFDARWGVGSHFFETDVPWNRADDTTELAESKMARF
jgi:S-adenosylmethionine synthetase